MYVSDLIELLSDMPQDAVVVMSDDLDGTTLYQVDDASSDFWVGDEYNGSYNLHLHADDFEEDESLAYELTKSSLEKAVIIWPMI